MFLSFLPCLPLSLCRTLYIEGERKLDFAGWCGAIQAAAGSGGDTLSQQQLTETDIPVIVHSCIGYITQCGERRAETYADTMHLKSHSISSTHYIHHTWAHAHACTHTYMSCYLSNIYACFYIIGVYIRI